MSGADGPRFIAAGGGMSGADGPRFIAASGA
jgi:hypothetical protein